jgi:hypothetical protein
MTDIEREERAIYTISIGAMLPVVIGVAIDRGDLDTGASLGLLVISFAVTGIVAGIRAAVRSKLPRATARFSRRP